MRAMTELILDEAIAVLERTPATLRTLLDGLPDTFTQATEGPGTWSPSVVVGHLIHGERADWMPRVRHILAGETRPFAPFDREAQLRDDPDRTLAELLATFVELRSESLAALRALRLGAGDLAREGRHPALGRVTLAQLLATWVAHDLDHLGQIARTMAKAYGPATGPWSAYLSILRDRQTYLEATQESGRAFFTRGITGRVVMLNLLRYRAVADYSAAPELSPPSPISGEEAYRRYMEHTRPYLERSGGKVLFFGRGGRLLVGPESERWDAALLVEQASPAAFLAFASDREYLAGIGHRSAALEDSRLLPLEEGDQ